MTTLKELEERVEALENELGGWREPEEEVDFDPVHLNMAAEGLLGAFDWEECPIKPEHFEEWEELYNWFKDHSEE